MFSPLRTAVVGSKSARIPLINGSNLENQGAVHTHPNKNFKSRCLAGLKLRSDTRLLSTRKLSAAQAKGRASAVTLTAESKLKTRCHSSSWWMQRAEPAAEGLKRDK